MRAGAFDIHRGTVILALAIACATIPALAAIDGPLHQLLGHRMRGGRSSGQPPSPLQRLVIQLVGWHNAVDDVPPLER